MSRPMIAVTRRPSWPRMSLLKPSTLPGEARAFCGGGRREFLAEVAFYNAAQNGLGARFASAVEEEAARALAFPFAGSPSAASTRRVLLKDFPFSLFYRP